MKNEAVPRLAAQNAEVYQAAAREAWHRGETAGPLRLNVISDSMRPLLRRDDRIIVKPIEPHFLRPGAVIVVQQGGEWITHRLVAVDERGWHTQGDNARYRDEAVTAEKIVGQVIAIERGTRTIDLQKPRWRTIDHRVNQVQRLQRRLFRLGRLLSGGRSNRLTRALASLLHWPFQIVLRALISTLSR